MGDNNHSENPLDASDSVTGDGELLHLGRTGFDDGADILRNHLKTMPEKPGVYRMVASNGSVLYVGKAKNLKKRVSSYTQRSRLPHRLQRMVAQTVTLEIVLTHTETEALLLEANLIQRYMPPFNVLLRDDKSYPYMLITRDHDFPQILRHRGSKERKGWYFGPFASAGKVRETITLLQRGFMLRNCTDSFFASHRNRPCLQFHIKRCTAPCVHRVSKEEYAVQVEDAVSFLKGKSQTIQQRMATEMQAASDAMHYELAAQLRDRIAVLTSMQTRQDINVSGVDNADVFALHQTGGKTAIQVFFFRDGRNYGSRTYYPSHDKNIEVSEIFEPFLAQFYLEKAPPPQLFVSDMPEQKELLEQALSEKAGYAVELILPKLGEKKRLIEHARKNAQEALARTLSESSEQQKLLARVAEIFDLSAPPNRIEVYDNSHIQGAHAIGAMIAAGPEGFLKKTYRKFNIRNTEAKGDDYAMMGEVLTRRFKRLLEEDPDRTSGMWPDLILIDGGEGQLSRVMQVANDMGLSDLAIVGIAKGPDRNAGRERFFMPGRDPFSMTSNDPALYYLQRLRDEAHRFAIGTHRAKRAKAITYSGLEEVPGIGATRKRALLHHFGSAKAVAAAGLDDLTRVDGISLQVAKKIHAYFHERG